MTEWNRIEDYLRKNQFTEMMTKPGIWMKGTSPHIRMVDLNKKPMQICLFDGVVRVDEGHGVQELDQVKQELNAMMKGGAAKHEKKEMPAPPVLTKEPVPDTLVMGKSFSPAGSIIKGFVPALKEIGKIKIGRKGAVMTSKRGNEFRPPEKFDHFEVMSLVRDDCGDLLPDAAVMGLIGKDCKELDVMLLYNDPTLNFMTRYNEYKSGACLCQGDGISAVTASGGKECNPESCETFRLKKCKPNGILSVILTRAPRLGGVYKFRTTSYNSIRNLLSSMFFIRSVTGGVLAGIPLKLTISPLTVQPNDTQSTHTVYVVNLEYPGTVSDLLKITIETAKYQSSMRVQIAELESTARTALQAPESMEEIRDVEAEFYPEGEEV